MIMLIYLEVNLDRVITEALSRAQKSYPMYFAAGVRDMPARGVFTASVDFLVTEVCPRDYASESSKQVLDSLNDPWIRDLIDSSSEHESTYEGCCACVEMGLRL